MHVPCVSLAHVGANLTGIEKNTCVLKEVDCTINGLLPPGWPITRPKARGQVDVPTTEQMWQALIRLGWWDLLPLLAKSYIWSCF